jgi:2-dehydropantoate 2-reductase
MWYDVYGKARRPCCSNACSIAMRTLIVGVGALGGVIATRLIANGVPVSLAVRTAESATKLKSTGLQVQGIGGASSATPADVAPFNSCSEAEGFDLIVLATKAQDASEIAPQAARLLRAGGVLLPIQNGGVSQILYDRFGECVLAGLSNLGATMHEPGMYEQRNAGHLLIGELSNGITERVERVRQWLGRGVDVKVTANIRGAIWSKLLLNCSVTTIGAVAGCTMREYIYVAEGRDLFCRAYDEALSVALARGAKPERMIVDPIPPGRNGDGRQGTTYERWLQRVLNAYGDLKPSMLQDFERGRTTEIDFINGYVAELGKELGVPTPVNSAIVEIVRAITRSERSPHLSLLKNVLEEASHN